MTRSFPIPLRGSAGFGPLRAAARTVPYRLPFSAGLSTGTDGHNIVGLSDFVNAICGESGRSAWGEGDPAGGQGWC